MKIIVNELKKNLKGMKKVIASLIIVCMALQGTLVYCYADDFDVQSKELTGSEGGFVEGSDDPDNSEVGNINNPVGENATEEVIASPTNADDEGGDETPDTTDYGDEPTGEEPAGEASPSDIEEEGNEENNSDDNNIADEPEEGEQQGDGQQEQQENGEGLGTLFNVQEVGSEQGENNGGKSLLGGTTSYGPSSGDKSTLTGFTDYTKLPTGSFGSYTLAAGNYIVEDGDITFTGGTGESGLVINGDVIIFVKSGCTLKCTGGNATNGYVKKNSGGVDTSTVGLGAGAGIEVPSGSTLTIYGESSTSKVEAYGGDGAKGGNGGSNNAQLESESSYLGTGGGGAGGGGAGAGIGTKGGDGGEGGKGLHNSSSLKGNDGNDGESDGSMGTVILTGYLSVTANSGSVVDSTQTGGTRNTSVSSTWMASGGAGGNGTQGAMIGTGGFGGGGGGGGGNGNGFGMFCANCRCGGGGGGGAGWGTAKGGDCGKFSHTDSYYGTTTNHAAYSGLQASKTITGADGGLGKKQDTDNSDCQGGKGGSISKITSRSGSLQRPLSSNVTINGTDAISITESSLDPTNTTLTGYAGANVGEAPKITIKFNANFPSGTSGTGSAPSDATKYTWETVDANPGSGDLALSGYMIEKTGTNPNWYSDAECTKLVSFPYRITEYATTTTNFYLKWKLGIEHTIVGSGSGEYGYGAGSFNVNVAETKVAAGYTFSSATFYKCDIDGSNPVSKQTKSTSTATKEECFKYDVETDLDAGPHYYYADCIYNDGSSDITVKTATTSIVVSKKTNSAPDKNIFTITNATKGNDDGKIKGFPESKTFIEYMHFDHTVATLWPTTWIPINTSGVTSDTVENLKCGKYRVRYLEDNNNKVSDYIELEILGPAHIATCPTTTISVYEQDLYTEKFGGKGYPVEKYRVKAGSTLPTGITLSESGQFGGDFRVVGNYTYTIEAYNDVDGEKTDEATFNVSVSGIREEPALGTDITNIEVEPDKGSTTSGKVRATLSNAMEYSIDGKTTWTDAVTTGLKEINITSDNTILYIRYKEDTSTTPTTPASKSLEYTVDFSKIGLTIANVSAKSGYTSLNLTANETSSIPSGYFMTEAKYYSCTDTSYGSETLELTKTSDMKTYAVPTGLTVASPGPYYYYFGYYTYEKGTTETFKVASNVSTVTIEKSTTAKPDKSLFNIENCTAGNDDGKIGGLTTTPLMEYKHNDDDWSSATEVTTATASNLKAGIWNIRYKERVESAASDAVDVIVYAPPKINTPYPITTTTFAVDDYLADTTTSPVTIYQFTDKSYGAASYKVKRGTLPAGISLGIDGKIAGIFTADGTYTFEISAYNTINGIINEDTASFTWTVSPLTDPAPSIASLSVVKATTQGSVGMIKFSYDADIEYSLDGKKSWTDCSTIGPDAENYYTISNIAQGTIVYIRFKKGSASAPSGLASKSYSIDIGKYVAPVTPYVPSSGGGSSGGGGGRISNIMTDEQKQVVEQYTKQQEKANDMLDPSNATMTVRNLQTETIINTDATKISWSYDPVANVWKMPFASKGFCTLTKAGAVADQVTGQVQTAVVSSTYFVNDDSTMHIGWLTTADLKTYYFDPKVGDDQGKLVSGWREIDTKWHYFDSSGVMLRNSTTPDGHNVDANGVWVK